MKNNNDEEKIQILLYTSTTFISWNKFDNYLNRILNTVSDRNKLEFIIIYENNVQSTLLIDKLNNLKLNFKIALLPAYNKIFSYEKEFVYERIYSRFKPNQIKFIGLNFILKKIKHNIIATIILDIKTNYVYNIITKYNEYSTKHEKNNLINLIVIH